MPLNKAAIASIVIVLAALLLGIGAVSSASNTRAAGFEWGVSQPAQTPSMSATASSATP